MGRGDDVDDRLGVGGILGGGVGDGLDARQGVGGQGLEVGLEVLLGEFGGLVVDPDLHAAHTAERDIALHVDLNSRGVLEGVLGGAGLDGGVVLDVVDQLLAIHQVEGLLGRDFDSVEGGGTGLQAEGAEGGVVLYGKGNEAVAVADGGDAEQVAADRNAAHLKEAVEVGGGTLDEGGVCGLEHGHIDKGQELAADRVSQRADHLEGVALLDFLLLADGGGLLAIAHLVPVAVRTLGTLAGTAALTHGGLAAGEAAGLGFEHRRGEEHHRHQGEDFQYAVGFHIVFILMYNIYMCPDPRRKLAFGGRNFCEFF